MAGDRVNNYSQIDSDILALQLTTDKTFKGYHQLTLTNYDNTTVPAIAAGSAIECNGALYKFDTEEAISTTDPVTSAAVADGTVYVCIVPGATTATAAFTATAPTWSDSKQGWYGTGGQANYRYAEYGIYKNSTNYYKSLKGYNIKRYNIGAWDMDATSAVPVSIDVLIDFVLNISVNIYTDDGVGVWPLIRLNGGEWGYNTSTNVFTLYRVASGNFDNTSYNDTNVNRGYVNMIYSYWV